MKRTLVLITFGLILSGCGQKGALYIPQQPQQTGMIQQQASLPVAVNSYEDHGGVVN